MMHIRVLNRISKYIEKLPLSTNNLGLKIYKKSLQSIFKMRFTCVYMTSRSLAEKHIIGKRSTYARTIFAQNLSD